MDRSQWKSLVCVLVLQATQESSHVGILISNIDRIAPYNKVTRSTTQLQQNYTVAANANIALVPRPFKQPANKANSNIT